MEILGHRGRPAPDTPENTLAAVGAALADGADGVEVDVRLTADGVAVCCHDAGLQRVAGVARGVRSLSLAELAAIRVAGHPVPTVADVLRLLAGRGRLVLDLKPEQRPRALLAAVAEAVAATDVGMPRLVLSSFDGSVLAACAAMAPRLERAVILTGAEPFSQILAQAVSRGDTALHVPARTVFGAPDLVAAAHRRGLEVRVWTVNRPVDARLLRLLDVDALITDVPGPLRAAMVARQTNALLSSAVPALD
ncbi:MAG: glycerophosphoryl diester phosphodiesterase [Frankiales bacterium]|nr:glycerophosphoryl diester phosphodiesterase [Frankiales bacterium]